LIRHVLPASQRATELIHEPPLEIPNKIASAGGFATTGRCRCAPPTTRAPHRLRFRERVDQILEGPV
jgi:hypothetical protein